MSILTTNVNDSKPFINIPLYTILEKVNIHIPRKSTANEKRAICPIFYIFDKKFFPKFKNPLGKYIPFYKGLEKCNKPFLRKRVK